METKRTASGGGDPRRTRFAGLCRHRTALVVIVTAASLWGCAQLPQGLQHVEPKATSSYAAARSLQAPAGDWPEQDWWKSYRDSQLDGLIDQALANSPTMAQAQARLQEAQARAGITRATTLPTVSADANVHDEKLTYKGIFPAQAVPRGWNDMGRVTVNFAWEIDFWGKNRSALDAAVSEVKAGTAEEAAARMILTTRLTQAYIELQGLFVDEKYAEQALGNREASEALVKRRYSEGLDSQEALEVASARTSRARADLQSADERVHLSRNAIAALMGLGPDAATDIHASELLRRPFGLPSSLPTDLVGRKPEVVAARWRVEAAAKRIGVARAQFYPNVNLLAFLGYDALGLSKLGSSGSDVGSFGAAVHLPIFEGGRLRANYSAATAEYDLAVATYNGSVTQALRETADAAQSLQALGERLASTKSALAHGENAYALAKQRYEGGLADYQTVLTAEDQMLQLRDAEAGLNTRGAALDVALVKALGGGAVLDSMKDEQVKP